MNICFPLYFREQKKWQESLKILLDVWLIVLTVSNEYLGAKKFFSVFFTVAIIFHKYTKRNTWIP
jgi:hypothetical protein